MGASENGDGPKKESEPLADQTGSINPTEKPSEPEVAVPKPEVLVSVHPDSTTTTKSQQPEEDSKAKSEEKKEVEIEDENDEEEVTSGGGEVTSGGGGGGGVCGEEEEEKNEEKKKKKTKESIIFPKFRVFASSTDPTSATPTSPIMMISPSTGKSRRTSASSYGDPTRSPEMTPETTLVEFISTSAGFHGIKKQDIKQLEWDILKVFANNVMPANAAAWYMAKRRFYLNNAWENQLLPFLLKKYPDKFYVHDQVVEFLDTYNKEVARKKLNYMVNQGLFAYFSHKADEYGVYFFDPYYYENTEPFHANLRLATKIQKGNVSKLLPSYFAQYKKQLIYTQHSPYLVTIAKTPTKMKINTTGIIVKVIDKTHGIIQFPCGVGTEKALFTSKSLFTNGWIYNGDPLKLDAVLFDGYQIPGPAPEGREYTWYAVLVWSGRKPSPKFCATKEDLSPRFFHSHHQQHQFEAVTTPPTTPTSTPAAVAAAAAAKSSTLDDSMIIGEILEIRKNGAVVSMQSKDSQEKAIIPGWRKDNLRKKGNFLTTTQGVGLAIKDLVGYYLDPNTQVPPFNHVGHQVIVLKHTEEPKISNPISAAGFDIATGSPSTRNGIQRQLSRASTNNPEFVGTEMKTWKMLKKMDPSSYREDEDMSYSPDHDYENIVDSSEYESFDEAEDVSDGELNFLRDGILELISIETERDPDWRSVTYLQKVMQETNNTINVRRRTSSSKGGRSVTPSSLDSGNATSREVTPTERTRRRSAAQKNNEKAFWRMKRAFKCLESYNSDDDPSYQPPSGHSDGHTDGYDTDTDENDVKKCSSSGRQLQTITNTPPPHPPHPPRSQRLFPASTDYTLWVGSVLSDGIQYCPYSKTWVANPMIDSDSDQDSDYSDPRSDLDEVDDDDDEDDLDLEIEDEELKGLQEDLKDEPQRVTEELESDDSNDESKAKRRKNIGYKRKAAIPYWLRFLLEIPRDWNPSLSKKEVVEEETSSTNAHSSSSNEEDDKKNEDGNREVLVVGKDVWGYESDRDWEYIPVPIIKDTELDYDEYSDVEISDDEVSMLMKEAKSPLTTQIIGLCPCGHDREKAAANVDAKGDNDDDEKPVSSDVESKPESKGDEPKVVKVTVAEPESEMKDGKVATKANVDQKNEPQKVDKDGQSKAESEPKKAESEPKKVADVQSKAESEPKKVADVQSKVESEGKKVESDVQSKVVENVQEKTTEVKKAEPEATKKADEEETKAETKSGVESEKTESKAKDEIDVIVDDLVSVETDSGSDKSPRKNKNSPKKGNKKSPKKF